VLTEDEILDLLAYLQSAGKPTDQVFTATSQKAPTMVATIAPVPTALDAAPITPEDKLEMPMNGKALGMDVLPSYFEKMSAVNNQDRVRLFHDLQKILEMQPNATFEFIGHADDTKYGTTNMDISLNRAKFAAQDMIYRGIPKTAISYKAMGDQEPSPKGNRRIEVIVKVPQPKEKLLN
jgi:outer membrane protein OmpA-like peptidoglycan-associated protein